MYSTFEHKYRLIVDRGNYIALEVPDCLPRKERDELLVDQKEQGNDIQFFSADGLLSGSPEWVPIC